MYLTYKDCRLKLDGIEYYASNVTINTRSMIKPVYNLGDRYNIGDRTYAAENGVAGELSFRYYLTGQIH